MQVGAGRAEATVDEKPRVLRGPRPPEDAYNIRVDVVPARRELKQPPTAEATADRWSNSRQLKQPPTAEGVASRA